MVTVITPRLELDYNDYLCIHTVDYFCLDGLKRFVEMPEAKYYWVEASDRQFKERNGCMVEVQLRLGLYSGTIYAKYKSGLEWISFEGSIDSYLKKLGVIVDGPSKKIWFRLLYEVK